MIEGALSPGSACLPCRARKTKCDGNQPVCGRCKRLAKPCLFERDPPRPLTQRLHDKILTLEEEIAAIQHQAVSITFPNTFLTHQLLSKRILHSNPPSLLPIFPISSLKSGPSGIRFPDHTESHPLETYGSVIPRSVIEKLLHQWDPAQEMPPILSDYLVRLFLPHRIQFYFRGDISSLLKDIHRPQSDPWCIHPALLNAIYLVACSIGGGDMSSYEAVFLPRVRQHMQQSLAFADRLLHFMWASILLGLFYTRAARTLEAYSTISATVRFAIGCGVDSEGEKEHVSAILPPAMDKTDSRERAFIWGAIYLLDRTLCSTANLPSSFPPEAVEHVHRLAFGQEWISPSEEYDDCGLYHRTDVPNQDPRTFNVAANTEVCIRVKILCLMESIQNLGASEVSTPVFWSTCNALAAAISFYQRTLSPVNHDIGLFPYEYTKPLRVNPITFSPRILRCAATIALQRLLEGQGYPQSFDKAVEAAHEMAELTKLIHGTAPDGSISLVYADIALLAHLYTACHVLIRETARLHRLGMQEHETRLYMANHSLLRIMDTLLELSKVFPGWVSGANTLRDALLQSDISDCKFQSLMC